VLVALISAIPSSPCKLLAKKSNVVFYWLFDPLVDNISTIPFKLQPSKDIIYAASINNIIINTELSKIINSDLQSLLVVTKPGAK